MTISSRILNTTLLVLSRLLFRVEDHEVGRIPPAGPLIVACNHINTFDAPLLIPRMANRPLISFAKVETWDNAFHRTLFSIWNAIPIRRGEADLDALRKAQEALKQGSILAIMPEGTRSFSGRLQQGKPGVALIALRSGAPIMPIGFFGNENFPKSVNLFHRPQFTVHVGSPFRLNAHGQALSRDVRQQMADEIMYQIAALLPEAYRGIYSDFSKATEEYLDFEPGGISNLARVLV
jgi:1-acyl-sn-glycerol-3-phosphate acyltransferase